MLFMADELEAYLDTLERGSRYHVERVIKTEPSGSTEIVSLERSETAQGDLFIRKRFNTDSGLGAAYQRIWEAQREGRRFNHLPRVRECYSTGQELVVVSDYVQGETLAEVGYRCDPSPELAADIFPRLCDAVSELHQSFDPPLIHRDLKPSNVILSYGSLTLIDFGIARTFDESADADTHRFGTRAYAPPEQFGYGQTDVRSDVYALGLLLFYLLTEKTPDADARKAEWRVSGVPEGLRQVIARATSFDPADRYPSADELKNAFLEAYRYKAPVPLRAPRPVRAVAESLRSFLVNVPRPLGVVWNVVVLFVLGVLLVATINSVIDPLPESAGYSAPLWLRAIAYALMFLLMFVPTAIMVCDRRPLRRFVKPFRTVPLTRQIGACVAAILVGLVAVGVCTVFFP